MNRRRALALVIVTVAGIPLSAAILQHHAAAADRPAVPLAAHGFDLDSGPPCELPESHCRPLSAQERQQIRDYLATNVHCGWLQLKNYLSSVLSEGRVLVYDQDDGYWGHNHFDGYNGADLLHSFVGNLERPGGLASNLLHEAAHRACYVHYQNLSEMCANTMREYCLDGQKQTSTSEEVAKPESAP